ncbi:amidase signature domain-containing protein [Lasiosphaeris hirsuta]|uniref:Glutamyl-tRNA(Gln) amidotransferase subunit A, mitochondrial n=1 Tax=Lasiosphaeris hirsuta TaxID=260670 RepID=A0AA40B8Y3_9PEZI|nr:amidase signature domain-containing protein [Lasiosphaeris hirsuta]
MSTRSRLQGLCLRHVSSKRRHAATSHQQRRLLNQFISKAPLQDDTPDTQPPFPPFTLAVKDNIATQSLPTTCASSFLNAYHSPFEATIVTQLRSRGACLVGKTNLDEFGMGSHSTHSAFGAVSQTLPNEGGEEYSAGGSSGGSAVAVAAGEADVALGTDTGGSVRLPAAYTGVVGFKPSYGMLSRHGVVPYANSLDTVGLLARGVKEIRELVVGGGLWLEHDPRDPTSLSEAARARCASVRKGYAGVDGGKPEEVLRGLKFGIPLEYNVEELDPRIRDAWAAAAAALQKLGARIVPVSLPTTRHALSAYYIIAPAEASSNLAKYDGVRYGSRASDTDAGSSDAADGGVLYAASRGRSFGSEVQRRILLGAYTLSSEAMDNYFIKAQKIRRLVRRDFDRAFALANPLQGEPEPFDLSDLSEDILMENKLGPVGVDFLLCPTAPTLAPKLEDVVGAEGQSPVNAYVNDVFTVPASLAGLPAVSIPVRVAAEGGHKDVANTAGLQLIGQYWDDARLLAAAGAVMEVLGGSSR